MARRRHCSIPSNLEILQREGRFKPFAAVPPSCRRPIESVLDEASELKSTVLLGFTRDGSHLVSYTTQPVAASDGQEGYCLQLWGFQPGARCIRLWSVPLFRTQAYLDSLADEEEFMAVDDMLLTVAETPDSSLLVVHGRSADPSDTASRDHHLTNYLTLIPGPLHAGAAQLQVAHLAYNTTFPHMAFNPYQFLTALDCTPSQPTSSVSSSSCEAGDGGKLAIALYAGDGVRYVHVGIGRSAALAAGVPPDSHAALHVQGSSEGDEEDWGSSTSRFPLTGAEDNSPSAQGAWAQATLLQPPSAIQAHAVQQQQQWLDEAVSRGIGWPPAQLPLQRLQEGPRQRQQHPSPVDAGMELMPEMRCAAVCCTHARAPGPASSYGGSSSSASRDLAAVTLGAARQQVDLEGCLYAALQQQRLPPSALLDYAAAPVLGCSWEEHEGLLVLAVLRLARPREAAQEQQVAHRQQPQQQPVPPHRSACVLLHADARGGDGAVVDWLEPPYPWHHDLSAFLVQQTAFSGVAFEKAPAFFAEFLRSRYSVPLSRRCMPLVLTNRSVLGSGQSLQHIVHPFLPIAILGYHRMDGSTM